jgi:Domain of unknown function (DUF4956)
VPDWLQEAFQSSEEIAFPTLLLRLVLAALLGGAVAFVYAATHRRDESYQPSFVPTLVLLSILIAVVTQVIGQSVARAFSLVGALAIVRFRTVVADTRDTAFVIFAVVIGMAVGAGHVPVALAGLGVGGAAAFLLRSRAWTPSSAWKLAVRIGIGHDRAALDPVLDRHCVSRDVLSTSTGRQGGALDLGWRVRLAPSTTASAAVAELNRVPGVEQVELVRL